MRFVLIDETGRAKTSNGSTLTADILASIATVCEVQANRDVATYWGVPVGVTVTIGGVYQLQPGDIPVAIMATLPNAPGDVAYHSVDGSGLPTLFVAITLCDTLTGYGNSLSVAISHEICETLVDTACNEWVDDGQGTEWAKEACDAVQAYSYTISGVSVSDFLTPAFFNPNTSGIYDYLAVVTAPFQTTQGGYQIKRTSGTGEGQVHGVIPVSLQAKKLHWSSRTATRLRSAA